MRRITLTFLALAAAAPLTACDEQSQRVSSQFTSLDDCEMIANGEAIGEDWISYKCKGLENVPVWLTYTDSARSYLGFGSKKNLSGPFAPTRDGSWPVEWRGTEQNGRFVPINIIIRMVRPEAGIATDGQGLFFVFRLRTDGTSCLVALDLETIDAARSESDRSFEDFVCLSEPRVPDSA